MFAAARCALLPSVAGERGAGVECSNALQTAVPQGGKAVRFLVMLSLLTLCVPALALDTGFELPPDILKRVQNGIERNRKGNATVYVTRPDGTPVPGATVRARQKSHAFLFGCAFPSWDVTKAMPTPADWEQFQRHFLRLFNYATTENMLKWPHTERLKDTPDYEMADRFVDWCHAHGITVKGHCLIWGYERNGFPKWLLELAPDEVAERARRRVTGTVTRYRGKIRFWDVVNEPLHCHWFEGNWGPDYAAEAFRLARQADPDAVLVLNEYGNQWDGQAQRFVRYAAELEARGAKIDVLGEQAHDHPRVPSPSQLLEMLDTLASTGKDVHLTEITLPSDGAEVRSDFVTGRWTPEFQGRYYRYYFTVAFSHPAVKAMTLWALWDGASWLNQGGIITRDWQPKPAYEALDSLINREWRTEASGSTFADGSWTFRGFHGSYDVTVEKDGKTRAAVLELKPGEKPVLRVVLP
jgi:endo-1,4-beta-xylanase